MVEPAVKRGGVLIFIPTFNDDVEIERLVGEIEKLDLDLRVLIVDDGSTRPLVPHAGTSNILFVRLPDNYGLGVATHIAFDHALRFGYRAVVRIDADGQHPVDRIGDLLAALDADSADVCVGVRINRNDGRGARALASRLFRAYVSGVTKIATGGKAPRDLNSGFLAFNVRAMRLLNGFSLERYPEPQILVLSLGNGLRVDTVTVEQSPRSKGSSSIRLTDALKMFFRFNVFLIAELLQGRRRH